MSDCTPGRPRNALNLPLRVSVLTAFTFTSNSFYTASFICGLVAFSANLKITSFCPAAILRLRRERMAQRKRAHFLRQVDRVIARMRTERAAAAAEQVRARRTVAGTAGALLRMHLLAGAPDVRAVLHRVCAGAAFGEL